MDLDFVMIPVGGHKWQLLAISGRTIVEHGEPLTLREGGRVTVVSQERVVLAIDRDGQRVRIYDIVAAGLQICVAFEVPKQTRASSITCADGVIYLGCHRDGGDVFDTANYGPRLFLRDLRAAAPGWERVNLNFGDTCSIDTGRKAIDELFVVGDRLLAIDDFEVPLYSFIFDIRERARPRQRAMVEMALHDTYEHIYLATVGDRWLATASKGINHGIQSVFLSLYELEALSEQWYWFDLPESIAFAGDVLFVVDIDRNLELIDLRDEVPVPGGCPDSARSERPSARKLEVSGMAAVDYVVAIPGTNSCIAVDRQTKPERSTWQRVDADSR